MSPKGAVVHRVSSVGGKEVPFLAMLFAHVEWEVGVHVAQEDSARRMIVLQALTVGGFVLNDYELCDKRKIC